MTQQTTSFWHKFGTASLLCLLLLLSSLTLTLLLALIVPDLIYVNYPSSNDLRLNHDGQVRLEVVQSDQFSMSSGRRHRRSSEHSSMEPAKHGLDDLLQRHLHLHKRTRRRRRKVLRQLTSKSSEKSTEIDENWSSTNMTLEEVNSIYTPWSKWSRCRHDCRQLRRRYCTRPSACGSHVLKEARPCPPPTNRLNKSQNSNKNGGKKKRRRNRNRRMNPRRRRERRRRRRQRRRRQQQERRRRRQCAAMSDDQKQSQFHIVRRQRLSQKTRGMLKFHRAFYTRWSSWTLCSPVCKTSRTRTCKFAFVCGASAVHEQAYCYTEGSLCEQWYLKGKSLTLMEQYFSTRDARLLADNASKFNGHSNNSKKDERASKTIQNDANLRCGVRESTRNEEPMLTLGSSASTAALTASSPKSSSPPLALKIIGGRESAPGRWPWQVAVLNKFQEVFCGGTLIAPGWVLTAAHCVRKHLYVRLREHDLVIHEGSEKEYFVEHTVLHPDYNPDTVDNDVALLKIPSAEDPDFVHPNPACLPAQNEELPAAGTNCVIIGWGKTKSSALYGTEVLHEARIPIVSREQCLSVYKDYFISDNMFCAGFRGGMIDSCAGDSGGPLLCESDGHWSVFGVTSFGEGCGRQGKFGIYARVPNFVQWIQSVVNYRHN